MKRYVALFVSLVLVCSAGPVFAGFLDALKGFIPGHHDQPVKRVHSRAKGHGTPNKGEKPEGNPSPNSQASPASEESPAPSPVSVQSAEPAVDNNQTAAADQSPKPLSLQNSIAAAPPVAIDPPPLY